MIVASRRRAAAVTSVAISAAAAAAATAAAVFALGLGATAASAASVNAESANANPATTRYVTGFGTTLFSAEQNFYAIAASDGYTKAQCTLTDVDHADGSVDWWATGFCTN